MVNEQRLALKQIKVRVRDIKRLDGLKVHERQPYWEIVKQILDQMEVPAR